MDKGEIKERVVAAVSSAADLPLAPAAITLTTHVRKDLGMNSLQAVYAMMVLEDEFAIEIDESEIERVETVGDIVDIIAVKLDAKHATS